MSLACASSPSLALAFAHRPYYKMLGALGLGGSKKKSSDLVPTTAAALQQLASPQARASEKAAEDASKCLLQIKAILYGDASAGEPNADQVDQLVGELLAHNIIPLLISELSKLEFEAKKDVAQIFNNLLRKTQAPGRNSVVDYILHHVEILGNLVAGYVISSFVLRGALASAISISQYLNTSQHSRTRAHEYETSRICPSVYLVFFFSSLKPRCVPSARYDNADIALTCGLMLRECIRHEALARLVLHSDLFYRFFEYVEVANFDVASDAFATFKVRYRRRRSIIAMY